jgi:hypothetical protein
MHHIRLCIALSVLVLALWGCSQAPRFVTKDEPWRADEERACLMSGVVRESTFVSARSGLGGPSECGALRPFTVSAAANGWVQMRPAALLRCPMIPAVDHWVQQVVMPSARHHFGTDLVELKIAASYSCRPMNHVDGARLSEHGHANALDISAFLLADGRVVNVKAAWDGTPAEQNFLRAIRFGACETFTTVLGPGYDANHHDHFHLDLARHGGSGRVCK